MKGGGGKERGEEINKEEVGRILDKQKQKESGGSLINGKISGKAN